MNIKTPLSPPRSNKILNQIQQHSQLIAHLSKEHKPPADFSFRNDTFKKTSSSPYKVEVKKSEVTKNILMNFPTYPKNSSKCTSSLQMNSSDYVGHSNPLFHENDKSDGTLEPTKEIAVTSNSEKVFAELVQLESVLLSSVTSNAITNKSETGSSNESQRNCSTPDKSLSCVSTKSTNTDSVNNENDSKSMTLHNMTSDGIKETKHISHRSTSTDVTKKTKCAEIDASCNSKISHVSSAAATTADVLYWRNKCFELENILKGYQEKAAMVRRLFNQKMQQNETKLQEILSRAQQAEHEISSLNSTYKE
ncbi:hypothetical protein HELRODRAFT_159315 [Helobdella robusta]|uniref:Uncharacterized protein n=1 Tax=Helobdella robusta TaxID=6412 RepID=T1ENV7_HELRO|nr:hypothetical protein HELRODRAFT_159315 [Helobdella robusta]ESO12733.1 hypothetical protein HELRODRAFT_159315 [Helobdella robusta]